ncbi:unnamed protein product [Nezara viridula]|uniref:Uncharacterized protein n=1 Tax=Nezara viridula TaxID=85310 RepID=A0A9P0HIG3_NEZVI|nr:unnamed protein product [Nezara viridula]
MTSITRSAIKAIKFYKHVVQSVEKFIQKCKPEYKVPGLYVVDSIVRQSRHQFSPEKDVFAPRFARNIQSTFAQLFNCPPDDKGKIVRVLNLWQKNQVFTPDVIQPLLDMASRVGTDQPLQPTNGVQLKTPPTTQNLPRTPSSKPSPVKDPAWLSGNLDTSNVSSQLAITPVPQVKPPSNSGAIDPNIMLQLQNLQSLLLEKQSDAAQYKKEEVKFDKKLLDFDYDEDDEEPSVPQPSSQPQQPLPSIDSLQTILSNPEVLRHLQTLQQQMSNRKQEPTQEEIEDKMRRLQEMRHQEEEFDKHLAQTLPNLPFAAECDFKPTVMENATDALLSQAPPPVAPPQQLSSSMPAYTTPSSAHPFHGTLHDKDISTLDYDERSLQPPARVDVEVIDLLRNDSPPRRSPPRSNRDSRRRRRSRSRNRHSRSRSRSRRRARSTSEDRETERRRKRGLPPIKKNHLAVCSTTLWIGHLSKLVTEEELSNTFGNYGEIVSINLIPPRGCAFVCMNRRQDADKALRNLKHVKLHSKAITIAWAPGKAMKEKEWKDYWEVETGTSYIPWNKLSHDTDFTLLEEGGMLDEETFPDWLKTDAALRRRGERKDRNDDFKNSQDPNSEMMLQSKKDDHKKPDSELDIPMPAGNLPGFIPLPETTMAPPPVSQPATPMPPPPLGLLPPPFAIPPQRLPGLLGPMGPPMMGPMGNVPLGVPPPLMMPPPPQQMVPRMPGPFNPGPPVGMMPMPPGGDKSKPPQMPGMPPDGFTDHIASMFGLPVSALTGMNLQQTLAHSQQQQMTKGAAEMEVDDPEEKDIQSSNLEIMSALGTNMVGNFSQPPPNFSMHSNQNQAPQNSNQNNSAFKGRTEGRSDSRSEVRSDSRSDDRKSDKEDTPRKNRERDGKDRHDDRDRDKRRRRDSPDRGRDRDRERRRGGSDRGRRDWGGKGARSSKWGDRDKDDERKDWKGSNNTPGGSNKENNERSSDDEMPDMKTLPLPPPSQQHEPGSPAMQFPPGIRPPGPQGPGGFGPRFGPPKNEDGHQMNMGMQGPPLGMGGEFMPRDFQPPIRGDFPPREFQPPMRGDFPPTRGDFQGPSRDFQGSRDFPGPPRDFRGPPGDFQGPPRDFQPRGDFQSPRGDFPPRYFGPRGPMRPPMGPQQGGPRHRQPNGPMFGPQRGPPGPIGMRGPRGIPPVRMDGPPHGFMGRGFPPRMRGGPPHRFGGPPLFPGNKGNMGGDGPPVSRRWGEDDRPPRRSRWSSAPDSAQQSETDSEVPHSEQIDNQRDTEDKNSEPMMPPGAEEASELPPKDLGSSDPPNEPNTEFEPKESATEFTAEAEYSEVNNVTDHADGSQSEFMENDNIQSSVPIGQPQKFGESHRKSRWSCASSNDFTQPDSLPESDVSPPTNLPPLYSEVGKDSEVVRPPGEDDFVPVDFGPTESQTDFSSEFSAGEIGSELVESNELSKINSVSSDNADVHKTETEHIETNLASDSTESSQKE